MSPLACDALPTIQNTTVHDYAAADSRSHDDPKNNFGIGQNIGYAAQIGFCNSKTVRIVSHIDFDAEAFGQIVFERLSIEASRAPARASATSRASPRATRRSGATS